MCFLWSLLQNMSGLFSRWVLDATTLGHWIQVDLEDLEDWRPADWLRPILPTYKALAKGFHGDRCGSSESGSIFMTWRWFGIET